ncbi:carbon starvation CstA family protein [Halarsenatibacter silvermanii]|uniref:Carbon starvation protein n=1 Tax=Halarsenatibacter silvermanii TaxID=321763 RepID=A0A1G9KJI8_9FIRM|nr:carbon starvation protein A [Halarsenatibacter silvermanii]SDL49573.1 carbon starvation protein [Halarsenatibacter silvermanii]
MGSIWLIFIATGLFLAAYLTYARRLVDRWGMDNNQITPAHSKNDGLDYVPAKKPILLGHHFASIAGAAPIIGPVTAAEFGWLPVFIWIVVGSIFIGAVHDMGSLFSSVRHGGRSIARVIEVNMGKSGKRLFSIFSWLALILVIAAFLNVTAGAFVSTPEAATASVLFILLAVVFGFLRKVSGLSLMALSVIGIGLLVLCIWVGLNYPLELAHTTWMWILVFYIFAASVTPVWILLQPRDYLNSFLLYGLLGGAILGILAGNPDIELAGYTSFQTEVGYLFPILFVTVACGSISGFHSLVSSGTTAKQLNKEKDSKAIGYGGMLIEGTLAVLALLAAAIITRGTAADLMAQGGPALVFATGTGNFLNNLGIPTELGVIFGSLTVAAFTLTSLDTAARLGRFIFQEYFVPEEKQGAKEEAGIFGSIYFATFVTVFLGAVLGISGAWDAIWPIFGSANQLLAALALLSLAVWLASRGIKNLHIIIPMIFMFAVTLTALVFVTVENFQAGNYVLAIIAVILFILAIVLARMATGLLSPASEQKAAEKN